MHQNISLNLFLYEFSEKLHEADTLKEKQKSKTQYTIWDIRLQEYSLLVAIRVF